MALSQEQDMLLYEFRLIMADFTRCMFAALASEPTKEEIASEHQKDALANPHGDHYKPRRRETNEIIAELKFRKANAMVKVKDKIV